MTDTETTVLQGPEYNLTVLRNELEQLEGFDPDWLSFERTTDAEDTEELGQIDLASLILSVPVGIVTNALYELIKSRISSHLEARRIRKADNDGAA